MKTRLVPLDSVRGLAAIGVACFWHYQHYIGAGFIPENAPFYSIFFSLYRGGWVLVDLFFVLSGFIFSVVYKEKILTKLISVKEYVVLRFSRLYPLHLLTLLIVAGIQVFRYKYGLGYFVFTGNTVYLFVMNLLFQQNGIFADFSFNAPSWSISVEIISYTLFFILLRRFKSIYKFIYVAIVIGSLTSLVLFPAFNPLILRSLLGFFVGCLLFESDKRIFAILAAYTAALFIYIGTWHNWPFFCTIFIFPVLIVSLLRINVLFKTFSWTPFVYLGTISYSIYLFSFPIQLVIVTVKDLTGLHVNFYSPIFFIANILFTLSIATLSYEFFEKRVQSLIRLRLI